MYSLILDSSTKKLYVSLVNDNKVLFEKYIDGRNDHAKNIVSTVDLALKSNNIETKDLSKVIVGYGPGSYTGVRMAVTVAKMITSFMNIELYTISTLKLMASGSKGTVKALIDARRGNAFAGVFDMENNKDVLAEGMYSYEKLNEFMFDTIDENNFVVDPIKCINLAAKVDEVDLLVPNYLRDTEAERNLK